MAVVTRSGREVEPEEEEEMIEQPEEGDEQEEEEEQSEENDCRDIPGRPTWRELISELVEKTPWRPGGGTMGRATGGEPQ